MKEIIEEFNIKDKVKHIVTDNASNIANAVKKLNYKKFHCFGHLLN